MNSVIGSRIGKILIPMAAVVLAFFICGIVIYSVGVRPLEAYKYLFIGAFGSPTSFGDTLVKATPLIFTALAAVFAYRCGMINLGAEGQFIMGAVLAVWFSTSVTAGPGIIRVVISMLLAMLGGAVWAVIPGLLKAWRNTNEMITTILLNYVATFFMSYVFSGPLMEANIPQTPAVPDAVRLTRFAGAGRGHVGILIALAASLMIYYFLFHTYKGYQLRAVGLNPIASWVNGFPVKKLLILSFIISGAVAGLGGAVELHGSSFRLQAGFGLNYGFDGVAIALIGQLHPFGAVLVAYLFAVLRCGANYMQVATGLTSAVVDIVEAVIIIFAVAGTALVSLPEIKGFLRRFKSKKEVE